MKVILLENIHKVGKKYEVREVAPGFARNFLIPQKRAEVATRTSIKRYEALRLRNEQEVAVKNELLIKSLGDLSTMTITLRGAGSEQGHLFAGIHAKEVAEAIKAQTDIDLAPEHIMLKKAIKEAGAHQIPIEIGEHRGKITLQVEVEVDEEE